MSSKSEFSVKFSNKLKKDKYGSSSNRDLLESGKSSEIEQIDQESDESSSVNIFADNKKSILNTGAFGRRLSWASVTTGYEDVDEIAQPLYYLVKDSQHIAEKFRLLLEPPNFDKDDIIYSVHTFMASLQEYIPSIKFDTTFSTFRNIKGLLASDDCTRLYGLLVHFSYWNIIHPTVRQAMKAVKLSYFEESANNVFDGVELDQAIPFNRFDVPLAVIQASQAPTSNKRIPKTLDEIDIVFESNLARSEDDCSITGDANPIEQKQRFLDVGLLKGDLVSEYGGGSFNGEKSLGSLASETSLSVSEKEQLFLQLETCVHAIFEKMGNKRFSLVIGRQALISSCHFIVDDILTMIYPWFASLAKYTGTDKEENSSDLEKVIEAINVNMRRILHQSISDLIDPARIYTSTMLLRMLLGYGEGNNSRQVSLKAKSLISEVKGGGKGKFYRTSAAILSLMGDTKSVQARKFLLKGGGLYTTLPGVVKKKEDPSKVSQKKYETVTKALLLANAKKKPLDFNNLFDNQPDAGYFPTPMPDTDILENACDDGGWDLVFSRHEKSRTPNHQGKKLSNYTNRNHTVIKDYEAMQHKKDSITRNGLKLPNIPQNMGAADSTSVGGTISVDSRSLVHNDNAEMQISLRAKAVLMNLMVDKASRVYRSSIPTNHTALRISLLKGET